MSFLDCLSDEMNEAAAALGYTEPTPIQARAIPLLLEGRDVIGQAQTGTGKTAAFLLPILQRIDTASPEIQAIVLCPTRELAQQITAVAEGLSRKMENFGVIAIYGGTNVSYQAQRLKGCQLIIGTPGRVLDQLRRRNMRFFNVRMVTLDEADEMLDMGFREDIDEIISYTSSRRQTMLFSATMPKEILELTRLYQKDPVTVSIERDTLTAPDIEQTYVETTEQGKVDELAKLIRTSDAKLTLVFCNTKQKVSDLYRQLRRRGFNVEGLHGGIEQSVRDSIMMRFRTRALAVLVATDIAARGLDISGVDLVVNFDVPRNADHYVHRIGRTGRAGRSGRAVTLVLSRDQKQISRIQHHTHSAMGKAQGQGTEGQTAAGGAPRAEGAARAEGTPRGEGNRPPRNRRPGGSRNGGQPRADAPAKEATPAVNAAPAQPGAEGAALSASAKRRRRRRRKPGGAGAPGSGEGATQTSQSE